MKKIFVIANGVIKELFRRKDFYFILILIFTTILYTSSFSFGGERGFYRYFKEIALSMIYIFSVIIAVSFASRQIPMEIESKSIYPLLSHPVGRGEFIAGKFTGVGIISILSFTCFYIVFIVSLLLRKDYSTPWVLLLEGYYLQILLLLFLSSFTILLSLFLTPAANIVVTLLLYFGSDWFGVSMPGYIYFPHPELFNLKEKITHTVNIVPGWAILSLTIYAICYITLFLYLSWLVFRKRNL
jgi:ABC-type transport system involved in multi-copper enzyme maturation permease subunit